MADEFDFSDFSWLDDLDETIDETTNLDFSYGSSITDDSFDLSDLFNNDDDYSYLFDSPTDLTPDFSFDLKDIFNNDDDYSYLFDSPIDTTPDFNPGSTDMLSEDYDWSWLDSITGGEGSEKEDEYQGIFGLGIGPKLNQFFTGGQGLAGLLGGSGKKSGGSGGLLGGEGLFGGSGLETLIKLAMINKLRKQDRDDPNEVVPIGSDAFSAVGQGQGLGSMPDYRIFNLQPALMPGVGYANAPPPEMKHGGLASLDEGPGDITLARLEPGEFVMTRKATDNIGAKNLYRLMKEAERMA